MDGASSFDDYRMPDELWELLEPLLPKYPENTKGGRPLSNLRRVADAIFYRLRTGCQWNAIPPELAPGRTAHQFIQEWLEAGVFRLYWQEALASYDDVVALAVRGWCDDQGTSGRPENWDKPYGSFQARNETHLDDRRQWDPSWIGSRWCQCGTRTANYALAG